MQARVWISKTTSWTQRYLSSVAETEGGSCMSKLAAAAAAATTTTTNYSKNKKPGKELLLLTAANHNNNNNQDRRNTGSVECLDTCLWVPHPRTGIYYPKGHEKVMEDVPNGAASSSPTYWIRSLEGVDKSAEYSDIYKF